MSTKDISELITLFNQQTGKIKNYLINFLDIISDGRVPLRDDMDVFHAEMDILSRKYDEIYQYAKNVVSKDELPSKGSSVIHYADAVKSSRTRFLKEQIADTKQSLIKFISIKSMLTEYTVALKPYQDEAAKLLGQISETTIEDLIQKTEAPKVFLSAMEHENIHDADGFKLLEQVSIYYPLHIQWGLVGGQYFFDQVKSDVNKKMPDFATEVEAETASVVLKLNSCNDGISKVNKCEKVESDEKRKVRFEEIAAISELNNNPVGASEATMDTNTTILNADVESISDSDRMDADILKAINKVKTGIPSASSFRKEVVKLSKINEEIRVVLPLLTNLGVLTKEQFFLFGVCMDCFDESDKSKNAIDNAVEALISKGFIAALECRLGNEGTVAYCLSTYCNSCLHKESIASQMKGFWGLSFGCYKLVCDLEVARSVIESALKSNVLLLEYVYAMKDLLGKDDYRTVKQSIKWKTDHYQIAVIYAGEVVNSYLVNPQTDIESIKEESLLLCEERDIHSLTFNERNNRLFVFRQGEVVRYELENGVIQSVIADDSESDNIVLSDYDEETAEEELTEVLHLDGEKTVKLSLKTSEAEDISPEAIEFPEGNILSEISPERFLERKIVPSDDEFCMMIHKVLNRSAANKEQLTSAIVQSVLLAKGAGIENKRPKAKKLSAQLRLATNLLPGEAAYTSENLAAVFTDPETENKPMMFAAYLFAMLVPSMAFDYGLRNQTFLFFEHYEKYFGELLMFKPLFNKLMTVKDAAALGFSPAVIALLGSDAESQAFLAGLRMTADACLTVQAPKTRMKVLPVLYNICFGIGSDLHACMELIAGDKRDEDSLEFIEAVLSEYCSNQNETFMMSMDKIVDHLNEAWGKINAKNKFKLEYDARDQALRQFVVRIEVMLPWVEHINNFNKKKQDISRLRGLKGELLTLILKIQKDNTWKKLAHANILSWMLQYMKVYLNGRSSKLRVFSELLLTGIIGLRDDGTPNIDETMAEIRFYEPWRNALRHIAAKKRSAADVKSEILGDNLDGNEDEGLKDNLHQLEMLGRHLGSEDEDYIITEGQLKEAIGSADERMIRFKETLELAYTYNQINETEKETLAGIMTKYRADFYESHDFACWRRFLEALEGQIQEFAAGRKKKLRAELDIRLQKSASSTLLQEADRLLEEDMNFAVTEEYINRFDMGETELDEELDLVLRDRDYFNDFLSIDKFDRLLKECRRNNGHALKTFGWNFLEKNLPKEWTSRLRDDSQKMVMSWPSRKDTTTPAQIQTLFTCLGFDVMQAFKVNGRKEEMFQVVVTPMARSMADYRHPIAAFGTQSKSPIDVIVLYGNYTEKQLVDTISSLDLGGISVVLIDRPIDAAGRRLIGEIFHTQTSGQNPFLLIDQVLFLYLAMHQVTERLPVFLKCTLPYTTYQPFVRDGGSTADEMFCGRTQELATIIDPNGACVVYGGRQLGKTALLERAESRCSKPENKAFAVYTSIIRINSEEEVVATLISDIIKKTDGKIRINSCKTLKEMCGQLSWLFRNKQVVSLHLLIDEVDDFLAAIEDDAYKPIQPLVDLKRETKNNFKFVIAGLHNVCRAKNATRHNGIFGQLGTPLCIKPLSPTDALKLLSRPLSYLGFQIDRYPHLETILTKTNYYPGILQFFGYRLVETLTGQYSKYYSATNGNPPFTLQDEQLGAVMNSSDLNKSIKDKFWWSLELDPRYFMIARCITLLYHFYEDDRVSGSWLGFKVDEIIDMANTYDIHCLEKETKIGFINLLDEMVEMGILSNPSIGLYRLRRSSFVDIIGENLDTLEVDIINNNEEV